RRRRAGDAAEGPWLGGCRSRGAGFRDVELGRLGGDRPARAERLRLDHVGAGRDPGEAPVPGEVDEVMARTARLVGQRPGGVDVAKERVRRYAVAEVDS